MDDNSSDRLTSARRFLEPSNSTHQLFLDFIHASADITITEHAVVVKFQKRAHNPLLVAAGFDTMGIAVPWLGGKRLKFVFG